MAIEADHVQVSSGIRWGETLGSPIAMTIFNKDWEKWEKLLSVDPKDRDESKRVIKPRPGHADLVGMLKYDRKDAQDILDRASARETAARVAVGAVCRKLLEPFGIRIYLFCARDRIGRGEKHSQGSGGDHFHATEAPRSAARIRKPKRR